MEVKSPSPGRGSREASAVTYLHIFPHFREFGLASRQAVGQAAARAR